MSTEEKPKIIVDDDWKSRVQAEREQFKNSPTPAANAEQPAAATSGKPLSAEHLPPASFASLVSMLVTQSLAALGQVPVGDKQKPLIELDLAKHYIDLLGMLEEKTKGNLSAMERDMLTNVLRELRMVFVSMQSRKEHSGIGQ